MGDIIELLFAIIAGFFWLFGGTLFKSRDEDSSYPQTSSPRNKNKQDDTASDDAEERQRQIREAIRRKIAERRQQGGPEPMVVLEPFEQEPQYPQEQSESFEPREDDSEPAVAKESTGAETFSRGTEANAYEQEMQARLQEIEATKRKAEKLRSKVKQITSDSEDAYSGRRSGQEAALSLGSLTSALRNPKNARAAIVYREILGKPLGLRSSSEDNSGF